MSSHPNPGNRTQYITKEASLLTIAPAPDERQFQAVKTAFASLPPAKSMSDLAKEKSESGSTTAARSVGTPGQPVPRPNGQYRTLTGGGVFEAAVPNDWTSLSAKTSIRVVPENGYGPLNGQTVFTHGMEFGVTKAASRDLQQATKAWLSSVAQTNPQLELAGSQQRVQLSQRSAIATPLVNPSPLGGREQIAVYTTFLADGTLFYFFTIVPEEDSAAFRPTFERVAASIRFTDR
jgi:hypothetical protein